MAKKKTRKMKSGADLYPSTGDPFDKAEGAMDSFNMPKLKGSDGLGDASDMMGKPDDRLGGFGGFEDIGDGGFGSFDGKGKKGGGLGQGGFDQVGQGYGMNLGNEKAIGKKVKKGKKSFDKEKKPFDMFGGLQQDF